MRRADWIRLGSSSYDFPPLQTSGPLMPTVIDTRKAFRRLQEQGGFNEEQADAILDLFADVDEQVATKR